MQSPIRWLTFWISTLGLFKHEGLANDYDEHVIYLTEDVYDGGLYRYVPARVEGGVADLSKGALEIARPYGIVRNQGRQSGLLQSKTAL